MPSRVQIAVAGSGKTAEIVNKISAQSIGTRSVAITFTTNGQREINSRVLRDHGSDHETLGWFAFLVRHMVRPYIPALFPEVSAHGLCFIAHEGQIPRRRGGWKYYFNDSHQPYSTRLALLAKKVLHETDEAAVRRLELIYDQIYIDEFQDLGGNDLVILEALMRSSISVFMTGDVRQSVLETSKSDRLNREYRGVELVNWFRAKEAEGHCSIENSNETSRFNQLIANFSDLIHDPALRLPGTTSTQTDPTDHDGVFLLDRNNLDSYLDLYKPTVIRQRATDEEFPNSEVLTFGKSKGLTRSRVVVIATQTMEKWLSSGGLLAPGTAAGFYVATTRAQHSVAIVVSNATKVHHNLHSDFTDKLSPWNKTETTG